MKNLKDKLYNYETPPPEGLWSNIANKLGDEKVVKMPNLRMPKFLFYGLTAAASLVIIFISTFFFNRNKEIKSVANASSFKTNNLITQKIKDSIALNYKILETIIHAPNDKKLLASNSDNRTGYTKKYITIAGAEGEPVKISPKAATLILSADNEYPPKPVWNKKIDKWEHIMLSNVTSTTSANLLDILQFANNNSNPK